MTEKHGYLMLNGGVGVYSVLAKSEEDAKRVIEKELAGKANKQFILRKWIEEGKPVRQAQVPRMGKKK